MRADGKGTRRPVAVALTGGIGAGKSEALRAFARHGAAIASSDEIVHRLLREDDEVKRAVVVRFGRAVVDDGEIDRGRLAGIVFEQPDDLAWLESLLHPRVVAEYMRWRADLAGLAEPPAVCVTEVPLLYESGGDARFDAVVAVTASAETRAERTAVRDIASRERRLIPDAEKLRKADFSYVNDGTLEELDAFVAAVMARLMKCGG
jgi:dephospho-CoA kinase